MLKTALSCNCGPESKVFIWIYVIHPANVGCFSIFVVVFYQFCIDSEYSKFLNACQYMTVTLLTAKYYMHTLWWNRNFSMVENLLCCVKNANASPTWFYLQTIVWWWVYKIWFPYWKLWSWIRFQSRTFKWLRSLKITF